MNTENTVDDVVQHYTKCRSHSHKCHLMFYPTTLATTRTYNTLVGLSNIRTNHSYGGGGGAFCTLKILLSQVFTH